MYTIYQNSNDEGHNLDSFRDKMIQICNQHRKENRALAFAFILYDFENPHLWKILNDREYWLALNRISGEYLTVFSLNYKEKRRPRSRQSFDSGSKVIQMLVNVPVSYNPSIGTNELIKKYFGETIEVKYPAILFFQVDNDKVIDSLLIELKEDSIEPAFNELKGFIRSAVDALKLISKDNRGNIHEVFDCLERNVESKKTTRNVKRVFKNAGNIVGLISSIRGLF